MARTLKWIFGLFGLLIGLILLAILAVVLFIDPNDYRERIASLVEEQTGRELRIDGEIQFSFFPWLGLELGELELGNAPGFNERPFASIRRADLRVKLLPLLRMQAEIDTIALHGLNLNLHVLKDGTTNWDDLAAAPEEAEPEAPVEAEQRPARTPEELLEDLAINGIEILDANIRYQDDSSGQLATLSDFNLRTGRISLKDPIPLELAAAIGLTEPALEAKVGLATRIAFDLAAEQYRLDETRLDVDASSELIPGGQISIQLSADLAADLKQQTASLQNLLLQALGTEISAQLEAQQILGDATAQGQLKLQVKDGKALGQAVEMPEGIRAAALQGSTLSSGFKLDMGKQQLDFEQFRLSAMGLDLALQLGIRQLLDNPQLAGSLKSNEFVPRQLLGSLGVELPEMADPSTLTLASLSSRFEASAEHASLRDLQLQFDQSLLNGSFSVRNFDAPVIRYQLALDEIDIDRYLPPPSEEEAVTTAAAEPESEPVDLPLELLRSLDIDGTFRIGKAKVMNLHSDTIVSTVRAEKGLFRIHPLSANLYQGNYAGNLRFDVRQDTPRLGMDERLSGVQAGPLLKDFLGDDYASGRANLAITVTAEGLDPLQVRRTLNGNGSFSFEDGEVKGINLGYQIRRAYALYKQQPPPPEESRETDFSTLRGSFTLRNGLLNTQDLSARSPVFQVSGKGDVNLVSEQLDLRLDTTIVSDFKDAANQSVDELKGITLPITVKGSFADPRIGLDITSVLRARAREVIEEKKEEVREQVEQRIEEEKERVQEQVDERLEEEKQKLQDRLFDRLRR